MWSNTYMTTTQTNTDTQPLKTKTIWIQVYENNDLGEERGFCSETFDIAMRELIKFRDEQVEMYRDDELLVEAGEIVTLGEDDKRLAQCEIMVDGETIEILSIFPTQLVIA